MIHRNRKWLRIALLNLVLTAILGILLRYAFVSEISWLKFRPAMHGHSHVGMLGWVFLALYTFLIHSFLPEEVQRKKLYERLFWGLQLSVVGMLISFPIQGYAAFSIGFSTLHVGLSYVFVFAFLKDVKRSETTSPLSVAFLRASLFFLILSTLALWAMGPIMVFDPGKGIPYYLAVQGFLHFQFNGWFVFAILALLFRYLEQKQLELNSSDARRFLNLLWISCLLTYVLVLTWAIPGDFLFVLNALASLIQLFALGYFFRLLLPVRKALYEAFPFWVRLLLGIAFLCFAFKIILQGAVMFPFIAKVAYTIRNFVIGFFHLVLLGIVTHFLLGYGIEKGLLSTRSFGTKLGLSLFSIGFLLSELILFVQGLMFWGAKGFLPGYYVGLFAVSSLMLLGLLIVWSYSHRDS